MTQRRMFCDNMFFIAHVAVVVGAAVVVDVAVAPVAVVGVIAKMSAAEVEVVVDALFVAVAVVVVAKIVADKFAVVVDASVDVVVAAAVIVAVVGKKSTASIKFRFEKITSHVFIRFYFESRCRFK